MHGQLFIVQVRERVSSLIWVEAIGPHQAQIYFCDCQFIKGECWKVYLDVSWILKYSLMTVLSVDVQESRGVDKTKAGVSSGMAVDNRCQGFVVAIKTHSNENIVLVF